MASSMCTSPAACHPYLIISSIRHDVLGVNLSSQPLQPAVLDATCSFIAADREPDAGEPVRNENKHDDEKDKNRGAVLDVMIEFTSNSAESQ